MGEIIRGPWGPQPRRRDLAPVLLPAPAANDPNCKPNPNAQLAKQLLAEWDNARAADATRSARP